MRTDLDTLLSEQPVRRRLSDLLDDNTFCRAASSIQTTFTIKSANEDEQIVYGEVYAPFMLDSHGEMMFPADIRKLAHRFLESKKTDRIDIMHNNKAVKASMVESYIARAGDPDYAEGAWVLAVRIYDPAVWAEIKAGKLNGYSLEALVYKVDYDITYDYLPFHYGYTEQNNGHDHAFFVQVDADGVVIGGYTSEEIDADGVSHDHVVRAGTATEFSNKHAHRYFLNEID